MEINENNSLPDFNKALFWDSDYENLDFSRHARHIIGRVLMRGNLDDFFELIRYYGLEKIKEEALQIRYLDKLTLNFCSKLFKIDKEKFRCYNTEPSIRKLWNY